MDNSIIAALSAILGSTVGGLTSFATTLFNQRYVTRRAMLLKDVANREQPYSEFLKEVASLYKDSLNSHTQRDSPAGCDHRYVLALSRIRMISSEAVLNAAEKVVEDVLEAYRRPPITFREFQQFWGPTRSVARVYQSMSSRASKHAGTLVVTLV